MNQDNSQTVTDFGTFKRTTLPDQIANRILDMIREKQLKPNDKLPSERSLAESMNVGRPVLREALRALALMNIIEIRHGAGAYVTDLDPARMVQNLDFVFSLDDSAILDLFDARQIVEVGLIELTAARITAEEVVQLEEHLAKSIEVSHDPALFAEMDVQLHQMIAEYAHNPILHRFMGSIHQLGMASRRRTVHLPAVIQQSISDHRAIVQALKSRDMAAAREAMSSHLENVKQELTQS
ncbi:MAG: FadR/GntR family transcriptional regulator [Chloroflexota bacterium]